MRSPAPATKAHEGAVQTWRDRDAAPAWAALPGLTAVDLYRPVRGGTHDPFNDDGPGPLLIAMLQFPTKEKLQAGLSDPRLEQSLAEMPVAATGTGFERRFFPVAGAPNPGLLRAPFSYVVRYHHPAENAAEFVSHYVADHPPILGKLPRSDPCCDYLPIDAGASNILPTADYMIGNEVAFDSPTHSTPRWRRQYATNCARISKAFRHSPARTRIIR